MSKSTAAAISVGTPMVAGVKVRHHVLDSETRRLSTLLKRVGMRLRNSLVSLPDAKEAEPKTLPSKEWLDYAKWYQLGVLGLLKEQRERARMTMATKAPEISDEEYERELDQMTEAAIRAMPQEKLDALMRERSKTIPVENNGTTNAAPRDVTAVGSSVDVASNGAAFDLSDEDE